MALRQFLVDCIVLEDLTVLPGVEVQGPLSTVVHVGRDQPESTVPNQLLGRPLQEIP